MARGRPADPGRAKRGTGHRPKPGEAKAAKEAAGSDLVRVASAPAVLTFVARFPAPASLPAGAHAVWAAVVEDLGGAGHMRDSYLPQLEAYCEAVLLHALAVAEVRAHGILIPGVQGGWVKNPAVTVQKDAAATMLRYADAMGLTPAARIRMALTEVVGKSILAALNESLDRPRT